MIFRRILKYLILPVMMLCFLSSSLVSYAETQVYSLTLKFITESGPVANSEFHLYYAMTSDGELQGDFAKMDVEVGDLTSAKNINSLAYTLASYAESGITQPTAVAASNVLGHTNFNNLNAGIYLITGSTVAMGDLLYIPKPALIRIPDSSGETVVADIKYDVASVSGTKVSRTVIKQWDDQNSSLRPKSVTIRLLQDGQFFDEVILSPDNSWTYTWDNLDASSEWTVIEPSVPTDYTVSIVLNDKTFTVVNKKNVSSNTTEPPPTGTTSEPPVTQSGSTGDESMPPSLPFTGQLWLPVPILFIAGLIIFLISLISERLSDENEKK